MATKQKPGRRAGRMGPKAPRKTTPGGGVLKTVRIWRDLTQQELAKNYKSAQGVIAKLESRDDIRLSTLRKVATTMGLQLTLKFEKPTTGRKSKDDVLEIKVDPLKRKKKKTKS